MQKLTWHTDVRTLSDLHLWDKNPRVVQQSAILKLATRIKERGFHAVLVIDTDDTILSGNLRKRALEHLHIEEVAVIVPDRKLSEDEREKIALESNLNDGEWDFEKLKAFEFDMLLDIGFKGDELNNIWSKELETHDDGFDLEEELKTITTATTKLGDVVILGNHRLICGDSTDPEVLKRLCGDEKPSMIYSDPVYNLNINYDKGIGGKQHYGGNVRDKRTVEEYKLFIQKSVENALAVSQPDTHVFYWCTQVYIWLIQTVYEACGVSNKCVCIWLKNGHNPIPSLAFNRCYEPCCYGTRGKPWIDPEIQNLNEVLNKEAGTGNELINAVDVWPAKRLSSKEYRHATQKPPTLSEKAFKRCSKAGDIILDSFCGSGSTIIAGEQLNRRVFGVELEPQYCDLIIRRFEKLTGMKARVIRDEEKS